MSHHKKKIALLIGLVTVLIWGALEFVSFMLLSPEEKKLPAESMLQRSHNQYLQEHARKSGCTFPESVIAHPMLGFIHRKADYASSRCRHILANNIGITFERDLPLTKKNDEFALFVLGGSVAEGLVNYKKAGSYFLEKRLNEKFLPPKGLHFRIYSGAMGAWAMPSQLNMLAMYGERVDGAISVDGYNEAFPVQDGVRLERVPPATYILSFSSPSSLRILGLRFLWAYQYILSKTWLRHSYFMNSTYRMFTGIYEKHILSPDLLAEFSQGNSEELKLDTQEARQWSLQSLQRYMEMFHQLGSARQIKTAEFMQPSRLYGKALTADEKVFQEFISKETYQKIDTLYQSMEKKGFPVKSLTHLFENETKTIYADHIHYRFEAGSSYGNELLAEAIVDELGRLWKLKKRP